MLCGSYNVFENRELGHGRMISLNIAVLPAMSTRPQPDPVFWLDGGPGVAATTAAGWLRESRLRRDRSIVMIDQRGTGGSNPLRCPLTRDPDRLQGYLDPYFHDLDIYSECLKELRLVADLRHYTTPTFAHDLDEVRAAMGFKRINLLAGSWGTRAALVYLREHGDTVRSAVLRSVAPIAFINPLYHAESAQAAIESLFAECETDSACHAAFPNVRGEFLRVLDRLGERPARVSIEHPETGEPVALTLSRSAFAEAIRSLMYSTSGTRWTPFLIHIAAAGNFTPIAQYLLDHNLDLEDYLAWGLLLSVTCAEDVPRIEPSAISRLTFGTYLGDDRVRSQIAACSGWPTADVPSSYGDPVVSDVPTLLWSGSLDPVVPPKWGDEAASHLSNSLHLVIPAAHNIGGACYESVIRQFFRRPELVMQDDAYEEVDADPDSIRPPVRRAKRAWNECRERIRLPPFEVPGG
jgi:pimeloyl-ACP methyl ester carboxylesterase